MKGITTWEDTSVGSQQHPTKGWRFTEQRQLQRHKATQTCQPEPIDTQRQHQQLKEVRSAG